MNEIESRGDRLDALAASSAVASLSTVDVAERLALTPRQIIRLVEVGQLIPSTERGEHAAFRFTEPEVARFRRWRSRTMTPRDLSTKRGEIAREMLSAMAVDAGLADVYAGALIALDWFLGEIDDLATAIADLDVPEAQG